MGEKHDNNGFTEAETNDLSTKVNLERQDSSAILPAKDRITFSWSNISVKVSKPSRRFCGLLPAKDQDKPTKTILNNVSGVVNPGEFLAIMGASGAGKSTLLNTLLFRNLEGLEVSGVRLANNQKVTPNNLTAVSAYVQQDDLFMGTLTVREHLTFQALVRMDKDIPYKERMKRVEDVIHELGLGKSAKTLIGVPGRIKGISGGEMKRLAFASEVLTNPPVFFCDEPTSGLDSYMASSVVEVLQSLAAQGRTVICTIHQPSSQIVDMFDKVLLMAEGRNAFLGNVKEANQFFDRCGYPSPSNYNPADHYIEMLAVVPGDEIESKEKIEKICNEFACTEQGKALKNISESAQSSIEDLNKATKTSPYKASWWAQFKALLWRSFLSVLKNPFIINIRIAQTVFMALIFGAVYFGQDLSGDGNAKGEAIMNINGAMFLCITSMTFSNLFPVIQVFCLELPIFLREHFNGMYRTDLYFITKQMAELPFFIITPLLFIGILYFMIGLNPLATKFFITAGILELLTQTVIGFGYLISCLSPSIDIALALAPTLMVPLMLFGGLFLNNGSTPVYLVWLKYISWFLYSNEALCINQWKDYSWDCPANATVCADGNAVLDQINFDKDNLTFDIMMLVVLAVAFRVLAFFALLAKTHRKK